MSDEQTLPEHGFTTIRVERLQQLEEYEDKLLALEAAGVDNWEGYDDAMMEV